jgi:benzil reductase ((S)-benzoin forming)
MSLTLITGASKGLGLALARQLEAEGQPLVEFSRSAPHAYSVRADLGDPLAFQATVSNTLARLHLETVEDELLVIHNAGQITPIGPAAAQDAGALIANLNANFGAAIAGLAAIVARAQALPIRRKLIVNISSGAAQRPIAGWSLYCAAKAGMEQFIRTLALEQQGQAHPFIAINVNPGVIDTGMQAAIRASSPADFPEHARFVARHAEGELADPAAVAARVLAIARRSDLVGGERYDASAPAR